LTALRGQPAYVFLFASWCEPCVAELPWIKTAYARYGDRIRFLGIDVLEDRAAATALAGRAALPFPVAYVDTATIDAQFVRFNVVGAEKPSTGWPKGTRGPQGTVTPVESGYYRPILKRVGGHWMMEHQRIYLDLPAAF